MVVTQESVRTGGEDHPKLVWMVDIRDETNPVIISTFPTPDLDDFFSRPGRYGAHNVYENQPGPTCFQSDTLIYGTFFNGGVRGVRHEQPLPAGGGGLLRAANS